MSVTPLFIIPIGDGYISRVKLGAGVDYYISPLLSIKTSKITNGFNTDVNYDDSFGYHVRALYEMYFGNNWSILYGLNWYTVNYSVKAGSQVGNDFLKRDGSGIDFMLGFYYNF